MTRTEINIYRLTTRVFIGAIGTVWDTVAEEAALDTGTVVASQHTFLQSI